MLCLRVNDVFPDNVFIVFIKLIFSSRLSAYLDKISSLQFSFRCELDPYLIMHDYALRAHANAKKTHFAIFANFHYIFAVSPWRNSSEFEHWGKASVEILETQTPVKASTRFFRSKKIFVMLLEKPLGNFYLRTNDAMIYYTLILFIAFTSINQIGNKIK